MNTRRRRKIHPNHKLYPQFQFWQNNYEVIKLLEHIAWLRHDRKKLRAEVRRLKGLLQRGAVDNV